MKRPSAGRAALMADFVLTLTFALALMVTLEPDARQVIEPKMPGKSHNEQIFMRSNGFWSICTLSQTIQVTIL